MVLYKVLLIGMLSLLASCTNPSSAVDIQVGDKENELKSLLTLSYIAQTNYQIPSSADVTQAESLFSAIFQTRDFTPEEVTAWASLNMNLRRITEGSITYAVISEFDPTLGRGQGFFAIKLGFNHTGFRVLQAPHRPSDLYTHEIVYELLLSSNFSAAAWSTTHRDNVDLCKENSSYFNAFTVAAAKAEEPAVILQLHGFDKESAGTEADVIFSSTKKEAFPPAFEPVAECLKRQLGGEGGFIVMKYPEEIQQLGGTLNINAQNFYGVGRDGVFFHVETSKPLRDELRVNSGTRALLGTCF